MCVFPVFLLDFHQQSRFFEFFPENILWVLKKLVPLHSLSPNFFRARHEKEFFE